MSEGAQTIDLSTFVPEQFKGEDGAFDTAKFRADYDEAAAIRSREAERVAAMPKSPEEIAFGLPEDHKWPEGFDPEKMSTKDEQGREVKFDPSKLIDEKDPDIPALQAILHKGGDPREMMKAIAGVVANREIRAMMEADKAAAAEIKALGPDGQARIATVMRTIEGALPAQQAKALVDSITSADALRAVEGILKEFKTTPTPAPKGLDTSKMSTVDMITAGLQARSSA